MADSMDEVSDGFHTFGELYAFRMLYHALWVNTLMAMQEGLGMISSDGYVANYKSWNHSDGQPCFGGGWFIVVSETRAGQVSNHYEAENWDLFKVPRVDVPPEFDGHTSGDVLDRLRALLAPEGA